MQRYLNYLPAGLRVRGRPTALLLTLLFGIMLTSTGDGLLPGLRLALFDGYQRLMPRPREAAPVQIVAIDEAALKRYGQWPWPRTRLAELIERMGELEPLAIGLDIFMPESDLTSPEALAARLPAGQEALKEALSAMPHYDDLLASTIRRHPIVLGAAGFAVPMPGSTTAVRAWPVLSTGGAAQPHVTQFPQALASLPALQAAASGQGLLTTTLEHGVVRRVPLVAAVGESLLPSLSMELLRVTTRMPAVTLEVGGGGVKNVSIGELVVPTQPKGDVWVHYSRPAFDRYVSALDVMEKRVSPELLANKIVIVAFTGLGLMDFKTNARGDFMPGVDVHAQLIESFFDGRFLQRPDWMRWAESAALVVCSLLLIWILPRLPLRTAVFVGLGLSVALFGGGAAAFAYGGLLFDAAGVWLSMFATSISLLASLFVNEVHERRRSDRSLQMVRETAAKAAGELNAARRIQMATLPQPAVAFPGEGRFTVAALLEPAKEVGGDLYDFFPLDRRRVLFMIGDVSGKGLPASLFMVVAKALSKSIALRDASGEPDLGDIVSRANRELLRENPEMLFVTAIAGILDADSGELLLCNAGHDAPRLVHGDGELERMLPADGPPLCVLDDFDYPIQRYQLRPGDSLCLTTDGISEAMDEQGGLYGVERLDALLARTHGLGPEALVAAVREDVRTHVGTAEPSDDLTLLVVRWNGFREPA